VFGKVDTFWTYHPAAFAGGGGRGEEEERLSVRIRSVASPVARGGRRGRAEAFFFPLIDSSVSTWPV
jgi:hypothetical protein